MTCDGLPNGREHDARVCFLRARAKVCSGGKTKRRTTPTAHYCGGGTGGCVAERQVMLEQL